MVFNNDIEIIIIMRIESIVDPHIVFHTVRTLIDPMHKWRQFKYSFFYIQISPTSLILANIFF